MIILLGGWLSWPPPPSLIMHALCMQQQSGSKPPAKRTNRPTKNRPERNPRRSRRGLGANPGHKTIPEFTLTLGAGISNTFRNKPPAYINQQNRKSQINTHTHGFMSNDAGVNCLCICACLELQGVEGFLGTCFRDAMCHLSPSRCVVAFQAVFQGTLWAGRVTKNEGALHEQPPPQA